VTPWGLVSPSASAPLLSPLCTELSACGHITPDSGCSVRNVRNIRSCDPVACLSSRQVFFYGTRYPVLPSPNGVLPFFVPCRAARRAAPQNSIPTSTGSPPLRLCNQLNNPFKFLQDVSLSLRFHRPPFNTYLHVDQSFFLVSVAFFRVLLICLVGWEGEYHQARRGELTTLLAFQ